MIEPQFLGDVHERDDPATKDDAENEKSYTVRLNFVPPPAGITVVPRLSPATTRLGLDKTSLTFTPANWNAPQTVTATAVDDAVTNAPTVQRVVIGHSVTGAGDIDVDTDFPVSVNVIDDDTLNRLSFDSPSVAEGDSGEATLTFTLTLLRPAGESLSVLLTPFPTGATATPTPAGATPKTPGPTHDFDRADINSRTVTFAPGEKTKTFDVTVYGDVRHEGDETVRVHVQSRKPSALVLAPGLPREGTATGVANAIATGTITDDDAEPNGIALSLEPYTERRTPTGTPEGRKTRRSFRVLATTRGDTVYGEDVTIALGIGGDEDTATLDEDFEGDFRHAGKTHRTVNLVLPEGRSSVADTNVYVDFRLLPTDDALHEGDEVLSVTGVSGDIEITPATHTITDDETLPVATLVLTPASIAEGASAAVTATLSGTSSETVTLTVAAAPGTDTVAGDFTLTGTTLTVAAGATASTGTVTIAATDNEVDDADRQVTVSATATGGHGVAAPADVTLAITDDDARGVTVSPVSLTLAEADDTGTGDKTENVGTYEVVLESEPTGSVTVTVGGGPTPPSPRWTPTPTPRASRTASPRTAGPRPRASPRPWTAPRPSSPRPR